MQPAIEISPIGPADIDAAHALLIRFFQEEGFATSPAQIMENFRRLLSDDRSWCALAHHRGTPVGIVTASLTPSVEWGHYAEIADLYIEPQVRGAGVARQLIDAAAGWCRSKGCDAITVVVTPEGEDRHQLSRFYAATGFVETGRKMMTRPL